MRETYEVIPSRGNDISALDDLWNESEDIEHDKDSGLRVFVTGHVCDCSLLA